MEIALGGTRWRLDHFQYIVCWRVEAAVTINLVDKSLKSLRTVLREILSNELAWNLSEVF
jgi:hypothetical protein